MQIDFKTLEPTLAATFYTASKLANFSAFRRTKFATLYSTIYRAFI